MATLCRAYSSEKDAQAAVDRLLAAGASGAEVQVIAGEAAHDAREAPVGGFAGTTAAAAEAVGSYADVAHDGSEAMGGFAGDPDAQRRGGFGDADRETVTTHRAGVQRMRVASHRNLEKMLRDAGLDETTARADVDALHRGRVLVLVRSALAADEVAAVLDG